MTDRVIRLKTCKYCPFREQMNVNGVQGIPVCAKTALPLPHITAPDSMGYAYAMPTYVIPDECPLEEYKEG